MRTVHGLGAALIAAIVVGAFAANAPAQEKNFRAGSAAYGEAQKLYNEKKFPDAAKAYEGFTRDYPGHASRDVAYYMAVLCYRYANQPDDAVRVAQEHEKVIGKSSYWPSITRQAAEACIAAKQFKRAAEILTKLVGDPAYADRYSLYSSLHTCYMNEKEYDKALALCDRFMADYTGPAGRKAEILLRKMDILNVMDRAAEMEAVAKEVEKVVPNNVMVGQAWEKVGYVEQQKLKRPANAYEAFLRASQVPGYLNADAILRNGCYVLRQVQPVDQARVAQACEGFLKSFPDSAFDAEMRIALAGAYAALKDTQNELRARRECDGLYGKTTLGPDILSGIVNLATRDKAVLDEGVKAASRLVEEFPNTPQAEQALLWLAENSPQAADPAVKKALLEKLVARFPCGNHAERGARLLEGMK